MNDDIIVVYTDGSLYKSDYFLTKVCNVGLGVYMIDPDKNDIKISKGFSSKKLIKENTVELADLNLFLSYIQDKIEYQNKKFVLYADSEDVVNIINNPDYDYKKLGLTPDFIEKIKSVNIKGAYWVKGHSNNTIGNLIVDTLAYNGLRMNKDNDGADYESINKNKHLKEIFQEVKRCPKRDILMMDNKQINENSYNRSFDEDNNVIDKKESNKYKSYIEKMHLLKDGENYKAVISLSDDVYSLNNKVFPGKNLEKIIDMIVADQSRMGEFGLSGNVDVIFENIPFVQTLEMLYNEADKVKNATSAERKEFMNTDEYHSAMFKLNRNKRLIIDFSEKPKPRFKI